MTMYVRAIYEIKGLEKTTFVKVDKLKEFMKSELMRVYNIYADKCNDGVTDILNKEFDSLYPTYFEDNKDKEWYDLIEYNSYIARGYQRLVVDDINNKNISPILSFYVEPTEVIFTGYLKLDRRVTISFYLEEV